MDHFIYKTICSVTGKFYIGMHSGSLTDSYLGSGQYVKASIKKHGRDQHTREILQICNDRKELCEVEARIVNANLIADPMCMNLCPGGIGGFDKHTEEAKQKMREKAKLRSDDCYVRGESHGMFGKTHSLEVRARISEGAKKRVGMKQTEEHRQKKSEGLKRYFAAKRKEKES